MPAVRCCTVQSCTCKLVRGHVCCTQEFSLRNLYALTLNTSHGIIHPFKRITPKCSIVEKTPLGIHIPQGRYRLTSPYHKVHHPSQVPGRSIYQTVTSNSLLPAHGDILKLHLSYRYLYQLVGTVYQSGGYLIVIIVIPTPNRLLGYWGPRHFTSCNLIDISASWFGLFTNLIATSSSPLPT